MYSRLISTIVCSLALASCGGSNADNPPDANAPQAPDAAPSSADGAASPDAPPGQLLQLQFVDPDHGPYTGGTEVMAQSQPRVSQHLKKLCDTGLLERFRDGHFVYYRVPSRGEIIKHPRGVDFEVVDADPRRIKRLRVRVGAAKAAE